MVGRGEGEGSPYSRSCQSTHTHHTHTHPTHTHAHAHTHTHTHAHARTHAHTRTRGAVRGGGGGFRLYASGSEGLRQDDREAVRLYRAAADRGLAVAQFSLGRCCELGHNGVPKDEAAAVR